MNNLIPSTFFLEEALVSVIMPTYNRMPLIMQAVQSVIAQTFTKWELIIVDDGSTDDTLEEIQKLKDCRIKIIALPHTGHIGKLRNAGAAIAKGTWLAFLDSDDCWLPQMLECQLETLQKENKRWVYGQFEYVNKDGKKIYDSNRKFVSYKGNILKEVILAKTGITICSMLVEKSLFEEMGGFSAQFKIKGDYEFFLRLALKAEAAITEKIILQVRDHANRSYKTISYSYELTAKVYRSFINLNPGQVYEKLARRRIAHFLSEAAVQRFSTGHYGIAMKHLGVSIWNDKPRHWLSACKRGMYEAGKLYF